MAIIKPSERFSTHKIGSSSDPTKPIGENDLIIIESVDETAYPDREDRVRVGETKDIIQDYFGTKLVYSRNKYNPTLSSETFNKYYSSSDGRLSTGLNGRVTGKIPVTEGKTYVLWATSIEGAVLTKPQWYGAKYLIFFTTGGFFANGINVNENSGGAVPNVVTINGNEAYKFTIPPTVTHVACFCADPAISPEATEPDDTYYPSMDAFRACVMLEEYDDYAEATKTTFEAYSETTVVLSDKLDIDQKLLEYAFTTENYTDESVTNAKIASDTLLPEKMAFPAKIGNVRVWTNGTIVYVRSTFSDTYDSLIALSLTHVTGVGYMSEYIIPVSTPDTDVTTGRIQIKGSSDDDYPIKANGTYIGGNHGLAFVYKLTKTGHGLTFADIGTVWRDGGSPTPNEYAIVSIYDANSVIVIGKDTSETDIWSIQQHITGTTLTEIGGAERTFTGFSITEVQFTMENTKVPHVSTPFISVRLNGTKEMAVNTLYYCDYVDLVSEYDIFHPGRIRDYATDNVGTFTANITQSEADDNFTRWSKHRELFRAQDYGCVIVDYTIELLMATSVGRIGFVQANAPSSTHNHKIYLPRAKANDLISADCRIRDYISGSFSGVTLAEADMIDSNKWTDRAVILAYNISDGEPAFGWVMGYNEEYADAKQANREAQGTVVWYIGSNRKQYPGLITEMSPVAAGTVFHAIAYRQAFYPNQFSEYTTGVYFHEICGYLYIYIDYHQSIIGTVVLRDKIVLPRKYSSLPFSVVDKTDNITLNIQDIIPSGGIVLDVDCTTEVYGYCILKVKL